MGEQNNPVIVLMSTPPLTPRTNPYATMLVEALAQRPELRPEYWDWRTAVLGRYDVLHLHWPESQLRGHTRAKTWARQALFALVLVRARLTRRPIVRTVHNVSLPAGLTRTELLILGLCDRWTSMRIRLNDATPVSAGQAVHTVPHGHYKDWFVSFDKSDSVPGRIAFFGLIRNYKSVPELAQAFTETSESAPDLSLQIAGLPSSAALTDRLEAAAHADARITLVLRRLDDAEIVQLVGRAELVVLPYPEMHNSGAVLTALSLDRPVLVPENAVNVALSNEVGSGWVRMFSGPLTGRAICDALTFAREDGPLGPPQLDGRNWSAVAVGHLAAYRDALRRIGRDAR